RPLLIWAGSGIAAAVVIAAVLIFGGHNRSADHQTQVNTVQPPPTIVPHAAPPVPRDTTQTSVLTEAPLAVSSLPVKGEPVAVSTLLPMKKSAPVPVTHVPTLRSIPVTAAFFTNTTDAPRDVSLVRGSPSPPATELPRRGWILGIVAAPDLSGT